MEFLNEAALESAKQLGVVYIDLKKEVRLDLIEIEITLNMRGDTNQYLRIEGFTSGLNSLDEGLVFGTFNIYKDQVKINFKAVEGAGTLYVNALKVVSFTPISANIAVSAELNIDAALIQKSGNGFLRSIGYLSL